jgi:hypothetical protein
MKQAADIIVIWIDKVLQWPARALFVIRVPPSNCMVSIH